MLKTTRKILLLLISNLIIVILIACSFTKQEPNFGSARLAQPLDISQLHKTVWVSEKFNATQEKQIVAALNDWQCVTGNFVQFDIHLKFPDAPFILQDGLDPNTILVILPSDNKNLHIRSTDDYIKKHDSERYTIGLFYYEDVIPTILLVTDRIDAFEFKSVAEHEIGHSLKIDHTTDKNSVMFPHLDESSRKITNVDLTALCNIFWCDEKEFSKNLVSCNIKK
jgi:hypothetical protein